MLYNERTTGSPPRRGRSGDSRAALSLNLTLYAQSGLLYSTPWKREGARDLKQGLDTFCAQWYPVGMGEQPPARDYAITVRFPPAIARGLEHVRRKSGVGPTDYIRLAVYRALTKDVGIPIYDSDLLMSEDAEED